MEDSGEFGWRTIKLAGKNVGGVLEEIEARDLSSMERRWCS
jgi:hypothetical protein